MKPLCYNLFKINVSSSDGFAKNYLILTKVEELGKEVEGPQVGIFIGASKKTVFSFQADRAEKGNRRGKSQLCDECLNLDRRLRMMDEDNAELTRQLQALQAQFNQAEQDYEQK